MDNYELCHWGIKGMKWGVRRRRVSVDIPKQKNTTNQNAYTKTLNKNAIVAVNRGSQMLLTYGLSRVVASAAAARGQNATAKLIKQIGNMTTAGLGVGMIVDLARNNPERGD